MTFERERENDADGCYIHKKKINKRSNGQLMYK
jgi:hypothetical protein